MKVFWSFFLAKSYVFYSNVLMGNNCSVSAFLNVRGMHAHSSQIGVHKCRVYSTNEARSGGSYTTDGRLQRESRDYTGSVTQSLDIVHC